MIYTFYFPILVSLLILGTFHTNIGREFRICPRLPKAVEVLQKGRSQYLRPRSRAGVVHEVDSPYL